MTRWLPVMFGIGIAIWVVALGLLAVTAGDSTQFGLLQPWLLMVNIVGLVVLLALIGGRLADLVRDRRGNVPGSRLRTRHVLMLCSLVLAPLLLVFTFSVVFLTRGIDSWFHVEVRQGLSDALGLSRAALDLRMREYLERTARIAEDLQENRSALLFAALDTHRRLSGAEELAIVSSGGRIDAFSADGLLHAVPVLPAEEMLVQARSGQPYVSLDPAAEGGYLIRAAVGMDVGRGSIQSPRVLVAVYPVPQRLADLAEAVQGAYQQYGQLSYLREPLKLSFVLTLSLVLLVALLAAVYAAFYFTDRLVRPVQDLIGATRAVAKGDFDTRLPRPSHDEIGYLVTSFNDMTKRLARARAEADRSRQAVESERTSLAVILARLSTGVISLAPDLTIRIANHAASGILGADLEAAAASTSSRTSHWSPSSRRLSAPMSPRGRQSGASSSRCAPRAAGASSCAPARRCPARTASRPAWCWCSTTSPSCCTRSARPRGAKWRGGLRTRSRTRLRRSSFPPNACAGACCHPWPSVTPSCSTAPRTPSCSRSRR